RADVAPPRFARGLKPLLAGVAAIAPGGAGALVGAPRTPGEPLAAPRVLWQPSCTIALVHFGASTRSTLCFTIKSSSSEPSREISRRSVQRQLPRQDLFEEPFWAVRQDAGGSGATTHAGSAQPTRPHDDKRGRMARTHGRTARRLDRPGTLDHAR